MPNEIAARAQPRPDAPTGDAYQAVFAALSESARGRAFLAEYARRNRNADTEVLLAALTRLEAKVARQTGAPSDQLRHELRALLETIRSARPRIDARPLPARAVKLAGLLDLLERRIEEMAEATNRHPEERASKDERPPISSRPEPPAMPVEPSVESVRTLAIVPPSDEPELPIPSPAGAQPVAIALVNIPEVSVFDNAPPKPEVMEQAAAQPAPSAATATRPAAAVSLPPVDPLAAIMALSEDERIALFT